MDNSSNPFIRDLDAELNLASQDAPDVPFSENLNDEFSFSKEDIEDLGLCPYCWAADDEGCDFDTPHPEGIWW